MVVDMVWASYAHGRCAKRTIQYHPQNRRWGGKPRRWMNKHRVVETDMWCVATTV